MAETRTEELRGNVTPTTKRLVDACAQAEGKGLMEWAEPILLAEAQRRIHAATLLVRMAGVNPFGSDRGVE
jgi:hypothetical protein